MVYVLDRPIMQNLGIEDEVDDLLNAVGLDILRFREHRAIPSLLREFLASW